VYEPALVCPSRIAVLLLTLSACSKSEPKPSLVAAKPSPCALAIVIDATGASIATTAGACHSPHRGGGPNLPWVEAELPRLKQALATCSEAMIVAETGPYQDAIAVMDLAVKTGFIDTALGDASDLPVPVAGATEVHCKLPPTPPEKPRVPIAVSPDPPLAYPLTPDEVQRLTEPMPLPPDRSKEDLQRAPVIIVTPTEITFQGRVFAAVDAVVADPKALASLAAVLRASADATKHDLATAPADVVRACDDAKHGIRPYGRICPEGLAILQADASTDMRVINAILHTATRAGFDNLLFAVKNR
jgi:phage tail protein X